MRGYVQECLCRVLMILMTSVYLFQSNQQNFNISRLEFQPYSPKKVDWWVIHIGLWLLY